MLSIGYVPLPLLKIPDAVGLDKFMPSADTHPDARTTVTSRELCVRVIEGGKATARTDLAPPHLTSAQNSQ